MIGISSSSKPLTSGSDGCLRVQVRKSRGRGHVVHVMAPIDSDVETAVPERSPDRQRPDRAIGLSGTLSSVWTAASTTYAAGASWLTRLGIMSSNFIRTDKLIEYARGGVHSSQWGTSVDESVEGFEPQELQKRSILTDIISYLKPASTSEMRYIRMLCDLCCLTYKFDKLTPSALNRLHRLVLITTSRACDLPLFKQPDSPEGIFVDADGMCSVPVPGSASSGPPSQLATAAGSPRGASPLLGTTSRRAVDVTSETGASGESAVSEKILEAQHAADLASLPINALVGAAGLAGSAISSTVADILEGTSNAGFLAWQKKKEADEGAKVEEDKPLLGADLPVEWYAADDPVSGIRYFVIQGTDNLDSWITNLTFEPVAFEDPALDVTIHRGVYEVSLVLYDRLLPLVEEHLSRSPFAKVCFTGHSLGGALGVCLMLMFRHRNVLPAWAVAPAYTFGVASAFWDRRECSSTGCHARFHGEACDHPDTSGHHASILERFGLQEDMVRNVIMHRDIVPRAFTCDYTPVRDFMRTWGPQYYDHGPLKKLSPVSSKVMMYTHVGRMYALQPRADQTYVGDDGYHPLLPPEAGLWIFTAPTTTSRLLARKVLGQRRREVAESGSPEPLLRDPGSLREAFLAFMDTPHPLEILAGPAYGDDGSISRYHNPDHYKKGLGTVYAGRRKALQSRFSYDLSSARKWTASKLRESAGGGDTSEDTAFGCAEAPVVPRTAHVVTNMRGVGRNQPRERSAAGLE